MPGLHPATSPRRPRAGVSGLRRYLADVRGDHLAVDVPGHGLEGQPLGVPGCGRATRCHQPWRSLAIRTTPLPASLPFEPRAEVPGLCCPQAEHPGAPDLSTRRRPIALTLS